MAGPTQVRNESNPMPYTASALLVHRGKAGGPYGESTLTHHATPPTRSVTTLDGIEAPQQARGARRSQCPVAAVVVTYYGERDSSR